MKSNVTRLRFSRKLHYTGSRSNPIQSHTKEKVHEKTYRTTFSLRDDSAMVGNLGAGIISQTPYLA